MQFYQLNRREFIMLLGGVAAWPLAVRAQQPAMPVIGFLNSESPELYEQFVRAFHRGLKEVGFVEGRNIVVEYRWAVGKYERLPALADELVRRQVAVIVANPPSVLPAKAATTTIPIAFTTSLDPVAAGIVGSLSRPGGNLTGITSLNVEIEPKRLELLHELVPAATIIAALVNPAGPNAETQSANLQAASRALGLQLHVLLRQQRGRDGSRIRKRGAERSRSTSDLRRSALRQQGAELAALAARHAVPAIWQGSEFVAAGGLASYGTSIAYIYRPLGILNRTGHPQGREAGGAAGPAGDEN
jgi:putative ABC transport system substrate-binding protein